MKREREEETYYPITQSSIDLEGLYVLNDLINLHVRDTYCNIEERNKTKSE